MILNISQRTIWLVLLIAPLILLGISHLFFQHFLMMKPCEQCVYIRFYMLMIALGAFIAFINPKKLKIIAYLFLIYGLFFGFKHSIILDEIHHSINSDDIFAKVKTCKNEPQFIFNIKFDELMPDFFRPSGTCGIDHPIISDDEKLNSIQQFFVGTKINNFEDGLYSNGWYLIPSKKFINMAQACMIFFALYALFIIFMIFKDLKNIKRF